MRKLQVFTLASIIALSGCATRNTLVDASGKPTRSLTNKSFMVDSMNENVQQCLLAATEKYKADQVSQRNNELPQSTSGLSGETLVSITAIKALQSIALKQLEKEEKVELARLGVPFSTDSLPACEKLGYSHMVIEKKKINHATLNNLGGKVLNTAFKVFGIYQGAKVALHVTDKLSEPKITSGEGSTNILGDGNNYQPDNRTNPCLDEGTCVSPIEEEMMEEEMPDPEDPVDPVDPDPIDPVDPDPVDP